MIGAFIQWGKRSDSPGWIIAENGCHLWTGAKDSCGYSVVEVAGLRRSVHRLRYEAEIGPVPEGLVLDHFACDNKLCCNPAHLRPVTHRENILRGDTLAAQMLAKTHCKRGHPLSGDNLMPHALKNGERLCLACRRAYDNDPPRRERANEARRVRRARARDVAH